MCVSIYLAQFVISLALMSDLLVAAKEKKSFKIFSGVILNSCFSSCMSFYYFSMLFLLHPVFFSSFVFFSILVAVLFRICHILNVYLSAPFHPRFPLKELTFFLFLSCKVFYLSKTLNALSFNKDRFFFKIRWWGC